MAIPHPPPSRTMSPIPTTRHSRRLSNLAVIMIVVGSLIGGGVVALIAHAAIVNDKKTVTLVLPAPGLQPPDEVMASVLPAPTPELTPGLGKQVLPLDWDYLVPATTGDQAAAAKADGADALYLDTPTADLLNLVTETQESQLPVFAGIDHIRSSERVRLLAELLQAQPQAVALVTALEGVDTSDAAAVESRISALRSVFGSSIQIYATAELSGANRSTLMAIGNYVDGVILSCHKCGQDEQTLQTAAREATAALAYRSASAFTVVFDLHGGVEEAKAQLSHYRAAGAQHFRLMLDPGCDPADVIQQSS